MGRTTGIEPAANGTTIHCSTDWATSAIWHPHTIQNPCTNSSINIIFLSLTMHFSKQPLFSYWSQKMQVPSHHISAHNFHLDLPKYCGSHHNGYDHNMASHQKHRQNAHICIPNHQQSTSNLGNYRHNLYLKKWG